MLKDLIVDERSWKLGIQEARDEKLADGKKWYAKGYEMGLKYSQRKPFKNNIPRDEYRHRINTLTRENERLKGLVTKLENRAAVRLLITEKSI